MRSFAFMLRKLLLSMGETRCVLCHQGTAGADGFCPACTEKLQAEEREPCPVCGETAAHCRCPNISLSPLPAFLNGRTWLAHTWYHPLYDKGPSDHAATALLLACKTHYSPALYHWIAQAMAADLTSLIPPDKRKDWILTYPPRSPAGYEKNGFDQCQEILRLLGRELGIPVKKLLVRQGGGTQKSQRDAAARADNVSDAFRAVGVPKGCRVLLFDDILTTGATMRAAGHALAWAGAACVFPMAFAKTISQRLPAADDDKTI